MAGRGVIAITNGRFLRDPSAEKGAVLFDTRAWLTPPLWQEGDACVAPTKVPSSVGAEACLASLAHSRGVKGDACVAATKILSSNPALLLRLEAGVLDHLAPLAELDLDEIPELLGRA